MPLQNHHIYSIRSKFTPYTLDQADAFKRAFYRLASNILGDTAVPEDLGALRMAFRDFIPSPGPQVEFKLKVQNRYFSIDFLKLRLKPYFPNVNNGLTADAKKESILSVSATEMTASGKSFCFDSVM